LNRADLLKILDEADVPAGPVNDVAEILSDPHVRARGLVSSFDYPGVGEFKALGLPYKFLGWDNPAVGRPPALGEHTESVLAELLGLSKDEISACGAATSYERLFDDSFFRGGRDRQHHADRPEAAMR